MMKFIYVTEDIHIGENTIRQYEIGILKEIAHKNGKIQFVNIDGLVTVPIEKVEEFDPLKTGDGFDKKVCNRCNRLISVELFQKNQNGKNNRTVRRPSCNECRELIDGANIPAKLKGQWEKEKPHMVIWECPICKKRTIPGLTSKVVLDHDHITGMPRAWICDSCNTGLGRFKDNIEVMKQAIKYLEEK